MVLVLLLGAFVGCGNKNELELSEKKKKEIETKWFEIEGSTIEWCDLENEKYSGVRYYGQFKGYYIIFAERISMTADEGKRFVGDFSFKHPKNFQLYAYKDGEFLSLDEVYQNGDLTDEHIEKIYYTHWYIYQKQIYPEYYKDNEIFKNITEGPYYSFVPDKTIKEIEKRWAEKFGYEIQWQDRNNSQYDTAVFYGMLDDCFVFIKETDNEENALKELKIGEYEFKHPVNFIICVYKNGEFYMLKDAYEKGWLTENSMDLIFESHKRCVHKRYSGFYMDNY